MLNIETTILLFVNYKYEIQTKDWSKELVTLINSQSREGVTVLIAKINGSDNFAKIYKEISNEFELNNLKNKNVNNLFRS